MMDTDIDTDDETPHVHGPVFDGTNLDEAKAFVQQHLRDGVTCPTCGQFCKVYRRKLNSTMALALCLIYQYFQKNPHHTWLHVAAFLVQTKRDSSIAGGDVVKLRYWGLLERGDGERDDGSDRVGRYRITDLGKKFVEGKIAVPRYVYLYNQLLLRLSEEMTTVQEALGDRFNYAELMVGQA
jgi:hypothetical protein